MRIPRMMAGATDISWAEPFLSIIGEINVVQYEGNMTLLGGW